MMRRVSDETIHSVADIKLSSFSTNDLLCLRVKSQYSIMVGISVRSGQTLN